MSNQSTPDFVNSLTNNHDEISDHYGRKEQKDNLLYELANNAFANPFNSTQQYGVICMLNFGEPQANATPQSSIKSGVKALIKPIGDQPQGQFTDEICKYKNDKKKLLQQLTSGGCKVMISEKILGDTNGYVPSVGDIVPLTYVDEGPGPQGKQRNIRWQIKRAGRASGGFDAACIEALGGNMDASLFANGNAGGTIQGGGATGPGGLASGNGVGARPGTISEESKKHWPSGIIGMETNEKSETCDPAIFNKALERMAWWMNTKNNPLWADKKVPYHTNYSKTARVGKPKILTIVDASPSKKRNDRNLWTFDLTTYDGRDIKTAGLLVWTWSGIGRGSFSPESAYRKGGATKGPALDFNNGNNHTSPGLKVLGGKRTFKAKSPPPKGSKVKRALAIYGIEPWNSREPGRGAIAHETKAKRKRAISFGCLATEGNIATQPSAKSVHFHAWEVWTGGSWLFVYTGDDFGIKGPVKVPGHVYWKAPRESTGPRPGADRRETWNWNDPLGGHTTNPRKSKKKKKKK